MTGDKLSLTVAFLGGLASFFSPCVIPLIPSYLSIITGISLENFTSKKKLPRFEIVTNSLSFIIGFSISFGTILVLLSYFSFLIPSVLWLKRIAGLFLIAFGLFILGIIKPSLLLRDKRFYFKSRKNKLVASFLGGVSFGMGWSPCIGPILGSILIIASSQKMMGNVLLLLLAYSTGFGIPFIASSFVLQTILSNLKRVSRLSKWVNCACGTVILSFGIILFLGIPVF